MAGCEGQADYNHYIYYMNLRSLTIYQGRKINDPDGSSSHDIKRFYDVPLTTLQIQVAHTRIIFSS
jgi:hypothetical protein